MSRARVRSSGMSTVHRQCERSSEDDTPPRGEAARISQDVFGDVFPPDGVPVLMPRSLKGGKGEDLDVEPPGKGAPWNDIADVVGGGVIRVKFSPDTIDDVRLDQWTVRGDAHDEIRTT